MPRAIRGALLECDPSIRALILAMDAKSQDLILEELDETHLLVDNSKVDYIKRELHIRLAQNFHDPEEDQNEE